MSDAIWANRFVQRGTTPAWHHKGLLIGDQHMNAKMALNLAGNYEVTLSRLTAIVDTPHGKRFYVPTEHSIITRMPTEDDPMIRVFGSPVSSSYELIGPSQAADIWDRAMVNEDGQTVPIETLGILRQGQEIFISAKIASFDVVEDQVDMYIVFDNPMYSNNAAVLLYTGVRPVCQNTLALGKKEAVSKMIIPHLPGAALKVEDWLRQMYYEASGIVQVAQIDFEVMANKHIKSAEANDLVKEVYPDPTKPDESWQGMNGLTLTDYMMRYDAKMMKTEFVRNVVLGLFGGDGVGSDTVAADGTVFGLYNAVAEYEDNRLGTGENRALGVTVGERANVVRHAYEVMNNFSRS